MTALQQLHVAAANGDLPVIEQCLVDGAQVNKGDEDGDTALHMAAVNGRRAAVLTLINSGAKVDAKNSDGHTPLTLAAMNNYSPIAVSLVEKGANVNEKDNEGDTPLHFAVSFGRSKMIDTLLNLGASLHEKNNEGNTVLHFAARFGKTDLAQILLEAGSKMDERNNDGDTPLYLAAKLGYRQLADSLIDSIIRRKVTKEKVIQEIKRLMPTSQALTDCIDYVGNKFEWSKYKFIMMVLVSFFTNVVCGYFAYFFDLITDIWFAQDMFNQMGRNFTKEYFECSPDFHSKFEEASRLCLDKLTSDCISELTLSLKIGEDCINNGDRFGDSGANEWLYAGLVSVMHCAFPIIFACLLWCLEEIIDRRKNARAPRLMLKSTTMVKSFLSQFENLQLALPIFTKMNAFIWDYRLYEMNLQEASTRNEVWTHDKTKIENENENNQDSINLSMINEAALESGFQVSYYNDQISPLKIIFLQFQI